MDPYAVNFVPKGWGFEKWLVNTSYCGKLLYFVKGKSCSWHVHRVKDEVFYVHKGCIKLLYGESDDILEAHTVCLNQGDTFHVYPGLRHKMIAIEDTELFEFSTKHEESDSIRIIKGD